MKLSFFDLSGKAAVISGGATGIGLGIAEGLAEAGANVAICARRQQMCQSAASGITRKTGISAQGFRCDVTDKTEIDVLIESVLSHFGKIDILVNCAGISGKEQKILEMDDENWNKVLDVNLNGVLALSRKVIRTMVDRGKGGKVINVASIAGLLSVPRMSAYCTSKAGLMNLTKVMALEWASYNIQVNAILPGYFLTPMNEKFFTTKIGQQIMQQKIPVNRIGNKEDIKGLSILLASKASDFMTASAIIIDGGQTATR